MKPAKPLLRKLDIGGMQGAYLDRGNGPPVVLVHCSSGSHRAWSFAVDELSGDHRVLVPDLLGYGQSSPWPDDPGHLGAPDLELVERLIDEAGEPVHLIGHSYGGGVCLEVARRAAITGSGRIRSLLLVEPASFHLLRTGGRAHEWREVSRVAMRCIEAADRGRRWRAAAPYMSYWLGRVRWWLMPRRVREGILRTIRKTAYEFGLVFALDHGPLEYASISCPTSLVRGTRTRRAAASVVDLLAEAIPGAELSEIPGAGHMSPFTHREDVGALIRAHVQQAGRVESAASSRSTRSRELAHSS